MFGMGKIIRFGWEVSLMKMQHWVCTYCGKRTVTSRRPLPGVCVKKGKNREGMTKPHSWVKE